MTPVLGSKPASASSFLFFCSGTVQNWCLVSSGQAISDRNTKNVSEISVFWPSIIFDKSNLARNSSWVYTNPVLFSGFGSHKKSHSLLVRHCRFVRFKLYSHADPKALLFYMDARIVNMRVRRWFRWRRFWGCWVWAQPARGLP